MIYRTPLMQIMREITTYSDVKLIVHKEFNDDVMEMRVKLTDHFQGEKK